jgi:cation diffusion facilitator CzcD-associated flavoprotein CzcO
MTTDPARPGETTPSYETIVIGSGFSGIAVAHELMASGRRDFLLLERADEIGGVWRDNRYPNAACDIVVQFYSLSFAPSYEWSCNYAPWDEILAYTHRVVDQLGIRDRIRLGAEVVAAEWDEDGSTWHLTLLDGSTLRSRFLVAAMGGLSRPLIPDLPGIDEYDGVLVHSAQWHDGLDLTGKRIAVIGSGASAIQLVPYAVETGSAVLATVRTAPFVMPKPEEHYEEVDRAYFREHPEVFAQVRRDQYNAWNHSTHMQAVMDPEWLAATEAAWRDHLYAAVSDPRLREVLTPDYRFGCTRPVVSNVYYPALAAEHTTVWDTGVAAFTSTGLVSERGEQWEADAVILATGFRVNQLYTAVDFVGEGGVRLSQAWAEAPIAYKGTMVAGFPNLFVMTGPNTQASGSNIGVIEAQARMVGRLLDLADVNDLSSMAVTHTAQERFNVELDAMLRRSVWEAGGCSSWYRMGGTGKVVTKWPGSLADFEVTTSTVTVSDLRLDRRPPATTAPPAGVVSTSPAP